MSEGIVVASSLRLRRKAGTEGEIVRSLPRDTRLEIVGREGEWLEVRVAGEPGFVHGDFVRLVAPGGASAPAFFREDPTLTTLAMEAARPLPGTPRDAADRRVASLWSRAGGLLGELADRLGVSPGLCVAVLRVESGGSGFRGDRLVVRFENHVFWQRWGSDHADAFRAHYRFDAGKRWQGHQFRASPGGRWRDFHGDQDGEWEVLDFSRALDDEAALSAISMGGPQIMGFNHGRVGYASARQLFDAFSASERQQIVGLFDFIRGPDATSRMVISLQQGDLTRFAADYNGNGQAARYAARIEAERERFERLRAA